MTSVELGLVTDDAERLVAFYVAGLGFQVQRVLHFPQGDVHRLRCDDAQLKIYQPASGAEHRASPEPWHRYRATGYGALHVDDAESVVERAVAGGATVITTLTSHRPGAKFALICDPDGNVWEILQESAS